MKPITDPNEFKKYDRHYQLLDAALKDFSLSIGGWVAYNYHEWPGRDIIWEDQEHVFRSISLSFNQDKYETSSISVSVWKDKNRNCYSRYTKSKIVKKELIPPFDITLIIEIIKNSYNEIKLWKEDDLAEADIFSPILSPNKEFELKQKGTIEDGVYCHKIILTNSSTGENKILKIIKNAKNADGCWAPNGNAFYINEHLYIKDYQGYNTCCFIFLLSDLKTPIYLKEEFIKKFKTDKNFLRFFESDQLRIYAYKWCSNTKLKVKFSEGIFNSNFEYTVHGDFIQIQF